MSLTGVSSLNTSGFLKTEVDKSIAKINAMSTGSTRSTKLDEVPKAEIEKLDSLKASVSSTEKLILVAKGLKDKTEAALDSIDKMRRSVNAVVGQLNGYSKASYDADPTKITALKSEIQICLNLMASQLSSVYGNGHYIFGAGKDDTQLPVNTACIKDSSSLAADGVTPTDLFVTDHGRSSDKYVAVSEQTKLNSTISATDPSFVNTIGGLWGVLNALDAPGGLPDALPRPALTSLNTGKEQLQYLLSDLKNRQVEVKEAIDTNQSSIDEAKLELETTQVDYLNATEEMRENLRLFELSCTIAAAVTESSATITRIIAGAAA